jgi:Methyltransferase domain
VLNRLIRYHPIRGRLSAAPADSILEVGSGNLGLGEFVDRPFVGCDLIFERSPFAPALRPVRASGTNLPFRDGAFHTVLCLDTMEHVPVAARPDFLMELLRVTNHTLIIGAPMGTSAAEADLSLHEYYRSRRLEEPLWLKEHIALIGEFPRVEFFEDFFIKLGCKVERQAGESILVHRTVVLLEQMRYVRNITGMLSRRPWRDVLRPFLGLMNRSASYRTYLLVGKP